MSRIERRWRLGVVAGLMALLTAAIVAGAGQSAPSAPGRDDRRGYHRHGDEPRPGRELRLRVGHAGRYNIYEHLYDAQKRREARAVARHEVRSGRNGEDVALHACGAA